MRWGRLENWQGYTASQLPGHVLAPAHLIAEPNSLTPNVHTEPKLDYISAPPCDMRRGEGRCGDEVKRPLYTQGLHLTLQTASS